MYRLKLRSRNRTNQGLKDLRFDKRVVFRMGSTTPNEQISRYPIDLEINTVEGCANCMDKRTMKRLFEESNIKQAEWFTCSTKEELTDTFIEKFHEWNHGCIAKRYNSSQGNGLFYIRTLDDIDPFIDFIEGEHNLPKYIFEKYSTFSREYRLHVSILNGCFYACRKMLRSDAEERWQRHDNNSVWVLEENPLFNRPETWDEIEEECVRALEALKLDVGALDIKVAADGRFFIMECNSAPGLGQIGLEKYKKELENIVEWSQ